jgi:hypothetical protein
MKRRLVSGLLFAFMILAGTSLASASDGALLQVAAGGGLDLAGNRLYQVVSGNK